LIDGHFLCPFDSSPSFLIIIHHNNYTVSTGYNLISEYDLINGGYV